PPGGGRGWARPLAVVQRARYEVVEGTRLGPHTGFGRAPHGRFVQPRLAGALTPPPLASRVAHTLPLPTHTGRTGGVGGVEDGTRGQTPERTHAVACSHCPSPLSRST